MAEASRTDAQSTSAPFLRGEGLPPPHPVPPAVGSPTLHNGSTSSSNATSPTSTVPDIYRTLQVRVWENQRWFPIVGWGTSRLPTDPPNLSPYHYRSRASPSVEALDKHMREANNITLAPEGTQRPQQPILPLDLTLPEGYMWDGYWEVSTAHQRGTDAAGWRFAENFTKTLPDGGHRAAHFKKTQTPTCVVRRRTWQRRVRLAKSGPTDSSPTMSEAYRGPENDDERAREVYLREKQDEMLLAESLKTRRQDVIDSGAPWTEEDELAAEEELRTFIKERRHQFTESATRRLISSNSFSNPFHIGSDGGGVTVDSPSSARATGTTEDLFTPGRYEGAVAASTWAVDSALNRASADRDGDPVDVSDDDEFVKDVQRRELTGAGADVTFHDESRPTRPDGVQLQTAGSLTFQHHVPSPKENANDQDGDAPLQPQSTINRFVAASTDDDGEDTATSPADGEDTNDFNAIFSKFMGAPEDGNDEAK